jgi:hypothetical protein
MKARMESQDFVCFGGRPGRPYIESKGWVTMERWVLLIRVVVSPRKGEASILGQQFILSCPGISARSGMVIVILLPMP